MVSLAKKRFGVVLVISVVLLNAIVVGLSLYSLEEHRRQEFRSAEVQTQNLAQALHQSLSNRIDRIDQALLTIVSDLETGARPDRTVTVPQRLLADADAVRVTNAAGDIISGRGVDVSKPVNISDRDYFIHHRAHAGSGLFMSKPLLGRILNEWVVTFSRRYELPGGGFGGIVLVGVKVESLRSLLARFDVGTSGTITLRSSELEFIARQPTVLRGQTLAIGDRNVSRELQDLVGSGVRRTTYHTTTPFDQVRRVFTFHRIDKVPLIVLVGMAEEDFLGTWRQDRRVTAGLLLAFLAVTLAAAGFLWRSWRSQQAAIAASSAAEARTRLFATVFQQGGEAFLITDRNNRIVEVNEAFCRLTGYTAAEAVGQDPRMLSSGRTTADEYRAMWQAIDETGF